MIKKFVSVTSHALASGAVNRDATTHTDIDHLVKPDATTHTHIH